MKILFLTSWFPSRVHSTHGNFVAKHARLVARCHEVVVANVQDDPGLPPGAIELVETLIDNYLLVQIYFGQQLDTPKWRRIYYRLLAYTKIRKHLSEGWGIPDLIHAHVLLDAGMMGWAWSSHLAVPLVITEHSTAYHSAGALTGLRRWLGRKACRNAAFVLPVSEHLGSGMRELNGLQGNYRQVSNVVDAKLFRYVSPPPGPFVFLHVSNFIDEHKNTTGLLRAFVQVSKQSKRPVRLHLAGDGDLDELQRKIKAAGLNEEVVSTSGPHTEVEVANLMQKCHVFVLPSHYENEPVVLLEAQVSGRPCIATRTGGIPEIMSNPNCGELVDVGSEKGIVAAMLKVLENYEAYDQQLIRELAIGRCSEGAVLCALEEVYEECTHD